MKTIFYRFLPVIIILFFLQKPALSEMEGLLSSMEEKLEKLISKKEEIERKRQRLEKEKDAISWRIREREEEQLKDYGLIRAILLNREMSRLHKISQDLESLEREEEELLPQISDICWRLIEGYNKAIEGFIKEAGNLTPQQKEREMVKIYSIQKKKERYVSLVKQIEDKGQKFMGLVKIDVKAIRDPEILERRRQELLAEMSRLDSALRAMTKERYLKSSLVRIMESSWRESSRIQTMRSTKSTKMVIKSSEGKPSETKKPEPKALKDIEILTIREEETSQPPVTVEETTITEIKRSLASDLARWKTELSKEETQFQSIRERQRYLKKQLEEIERRLREIKETEG